MELSWVDTLCCERGSAPVKVPAWGHTRACGFLQQQPPLTTVCTYTSGTQLHSLDRFRDNASERTQSIAFFCRSLWLQSLESVSERLQQAFESKREGFYPEYRAILRAGSALLKYKHSPTLWWEKPSAAPPVLEYTEGTTDHTFLSLRQACCWPRCSPRTHFFSTMIHNWRLLTRRADLCRAAEVLTFQLWNLQPLVFSINLWRGISWQTATWKDKGSVQLQMLSNLNIYLPFTIFNVKIY